MIILALGLYWYMRHKRGNPRTMRRMDSFEELDLGSTNTSTSNNL